MHWAGHTRTHSPQREHMSRNSFSGRAPGGRSQMGWGGGGNFHLDFLQLVVDSASEFVAEGYFHCQLRMLRWFLPRTLQDEGAKHAEGVPAGFEGGRVEGPVADAVVAGEVEIERVNFD